MTTHTHDAYFKAIFRNPTTAADALRRLFVPALAAAIDWDHFEPVPTEYIADDLGNTRADLVFRTRMSGRDAYIYVLYEHQSSVDPMMPFRVIVYMVRIWQSWLEDNPGARHLPPIVPVLLYNGARPWTGPLDFHALFDRVPPEVLDALRPHLPAFEVLLDDLVRTDDDQLESTTRRALATVGLLMLKHAAHDPDLRPVVDRLMQHLIEIATSPGGLASIVSTLYYAYENSDLPRGTIEERLKPHLDPAAQEVLMTTAEKLRAEGREEGHNALLAEVLRRRFGPLPPAVADRIERASPTERERWLDRIFVAGRVDEIFVD